MPKCISMICLSYCLRLSKYDTIKSVNFGHVTSRDVIIICINEYNHLALQSYSVGKWIHTYRTRDFELFNTHSDWFLNGGLWLDFVSFYHQILSNRWLGNTNFRIRKKKLNSTLTGFLLMQIFYILAFWAKMGTLIIRPRLLGASTFSPS